MKKTGWIVAILLAFVLGAFLSPLNSNTSESLNVQKSVEESAVEMDSMAWEQAPELNLEQILHGPAADSVSWESLRGKVVVLDFWATWCGPCLSSMPRVNELAEQLADRPIQFIAITDETESEVTPLLKELPIHGWIGLDTDRSVFEGFAVQGIPHCIVVDADGRIAGITDPRRLTAEHLEKLLNGEDPGIPRPTLAEVRAENSKANTSQSNALFEIAIRPTTSNPCGMRYGKGKLTTLGSTVSDIIPIAYGVPRSHVSIETDLPEGRFEFSITHPSKDQDTAMTGLQYALESTFGLKVTTESREMEVFVLSASADAKSRLIEPSSLLADRRKAWGAFEEGFEFYSIGMDQLATGFLDRCFNKPVVDETGLTSVYDFKIICDHADSRDPVVMADLLIDQLGLILKPEMRPVDVLVVDKADPDSADRVGLVQPNRGD